jgi:FixJ family two-component response regulator
MPHRILLVEDDAATRKGLAALLTSAGYEVLAIGSLKAAITALVEESPDLLITDVRLEDSNGLHLVAVNPKQIPVIVVTGYPDRALEADARRFGAAFLLKPIRPSELLELVELQLTTSRHERRWPRKRPTTALAARVDTAPVRVIDVSYGGMGLVMDGASALLPPSVRVTFPSAALSVPVQVVWQRPKDESWQFGAVVPDEWLPSWRQLVDAVS